jgi:hypothetical protein
MGRIRSGLGAITVVCLAPAVGAPAAAAPPSNDTVAGAIPIVGLPFDDEIDTSEATTDQAELDAIAPCGGVPAVERAVWYVAQVTTDATAVRTDVSGSDYGAGIAVFVGEPTAAGFVTCAPDSVEGPVSAGQTIYLMIFADTVGDPGATLRISVEAVELPTVGVTVDEVGAVDAKTGTASVSGTVTCTGDVAFVDVSGTLRQRAGRVIVQGPIFFQAIEPLCDGSAIAWESPVRAPLGLFKGGNATASVSAFACTENFDCAEETVEVEVALRGKPR